MSVFVNVYWGSDNNLHITLLCIARREFSPPPSSPATEPRANELKMKGKENFHKSCTSVDISTSSPFWTVAVGESFDRQTH